MEIKDFENKIIEGDCIEIMKTLPDNSVDAIITDPPYGLEFMGKDWDKFKEGKNIAGGTTGEGTPFGRSKPLASFYQMNKKRFGIKGEEGENDLKVKKNFNVLPRFFQSDLITFKKFTTNWAKECLRVIKPGGYLLSFGGTRTYHRMACGIEDAGFEIRDCIMWLYGSGFPKSYNIAKGIEGGKTSGSSNTTKFREIKGETKRIVSGYTKMHKEQGARPNNYNERMGESVIKPEFTSPEAKQWEGWGTALKPAVEPIVVARKPLSEKNVALNVLKWGTGGINIDECRIKYISEKDKEGARVGFKEGEIQRGENGIMMREGTPFKSNNGLSITGEQGRFPANLILDEEVGQMLDEQSGISISKQQLMGSGIENIKDASIYGKYMDIKSIKGHNDKGGASRFFYCAKASKSERNFGCENLEEKDKKRFGSGGRTQINGEWIETNSERKPFLNNHPTVKPISLMKYLIKLVSKEGAIILDPFLGSGTTAIACIKLNRKFIGIEKEEDYIKIAKARIKPFLEQQTLF